MKVTNIKSLVAVLMSLLMSSSVLAQHVSESEAKTKAMEFFSNGAKKLPAKNGIKRQAPAVQDVKLAYTSVKEGKTCFYVFNNGDDGGFVIVGGDEVSKEILAFSDHGHFDYDKAPGNFKNMLEQYAEQISLAKPVEQKRMAKAPATNVKKEDISDLIETTWDQWDPYNRAIPKLVNSNTGEEFAPPTGCVQTAVAQIMKYWNYPTQGIGQETRVLDYSHINGYSPGDANYTPEFGTMVHDIDFENTTYDWANMLNHYTGEETEEQINAVSTLMYHAGVACQAVWGVIETTGAYPEKGLKTYFGYSPKAEDINRDEYDDEIWEDIIYGELALNRPVLYSGFGEGYVGHEYIIHGYSSDYDMYKVNWGWGGMFDCYCKLTPVSGSTLMGYENHQTAIMRLQPTTLDNADNPDYGDTFWESGVKYSILSKYYNYVAVVRPELTEQQYSGNIVVPESVMYNGKAYTVVHISKYSFSKLRETENGEFGRADIYIDSIRIDARVKSIGYSAFDQCSAERIEIPNSVTKIGAYCFQACTSLRKLVLPDNIKTISAGAISNCSNLESLFLPALATRIEETSCYFNTSLKDLTLPYALESIGSWAFYGNKNLYTWNCLATVPPTLDALEFTFPSIISSATLYVPREAIQAYQSAVGWKNFGTILAYEDKETYDADIEVVVDDIIYRVNSTGAIIVGCNCASSEIVLSDTINVNGNNYPVVAIGEQAFSGRPWIKSISFPNTLKSIYDEAFNGAELHKLVLPASLQEIYSAAISDNISVIFSYATTPPVVPNLRSQPSSDMVLVVPAGSKALYQQADYWKLVKTIVTFDEVDENLGETFYYDNQKYIISLDGVYLEKANEQDTIIIPEHVLYNESQYTVTSILAWAFHLNNTVKYIELPGTIQSLCWGALGNVPNLERLVLKTGIQELTSYFVSNHNLTEMIIPEGVVHIGNGAFDGTTLRKGVIPSTVQEFVPYITTPNLEELYILAETLPIDPRGDLYSDMTEMPSECILYVPTSAIELYRADSYWKRAKGIRPITPLTSIEMNMQQLELYTGSSASLTYQSTPIDSHLNYVEWTSSDPTIASVNQDGVVIAHKEGIVTITATSMYYPEISSSCEVRVYISGDVNSDSSVNTTDAVCIINDRLGYESANFIRTRSDVNRDEQYTITDAIAVLNIMYGEPVGANAAPRKVQSQEESLGLSLMDNNTIALDLNCANGYTAFQFDVELPEGIILDGISLNENRCKDFAVRFNKTDNNIYKVVAYNLANEPLTIGGDNLLTINLSGANESDEVRLTNIHFSTLKAVDVLFEDMALNMTTGILSHAVSGDDVEYNVAGLRVNKDYRGIVIVNGKKVIKK